MVYGMANTHNHVIHIYIHCICIRIEISFSVSPCSKLHNLNGHLRYPNSSFQSILQPTPLHKWCGHETYWIYIWILILALESPLSRFLLKWFQEKNIFSKGGCTIQKPWQTSPFPLFCWATPRHRKHTKNSCTFHASNVACSTWEWKSGRSSEGWSTAVTLLGNH